MALLLVLAPAAGRLGAQGRGQAAPPRPENLLAGTIEMHQHHDPDERERNTDAIDAAFYARLRGMRGLVLKSHGQETAGVAWLTAKMVPGIDIVSVMTLDLVHGGLNKYAVEQFATVVKKPNNPSSRIGVVMFATDSVCRPNVKEECVAVSKNGQLLPETVEIIALVKKHGLILNGGHLSPEDNLLVFREGKRQGITQMGATHVNLDPPGLAGNLALAKEAASLGVYLEFASKTQRPGGLDGHVAFKDQSQATTEARNAWDAKVIREIGPEHVILEGDLGAIRNELGPDGLEAYIRNLRALGFTKAETDMMTKTNPAKLLGLPVLAGASQ
jgi:hypothetical protein